MKARGFICALGLLVSSAAMAAETVPPKFTKKPTATKTKAGEKTRPKLKLKDGDVVAFCGDSITSNGQYPGFVELYQLLCGPRMKVTFVNCGRWGKTAGTFPKTWDKDFVPAKPSVVTLCYGMNTGRGGRAINDATVAREAGALKVIVTKFREIGGRVVLLGSPGCVDSEFHRAPAAANANLAKLRDNARKVAEETGVTFVDVHTPMIEVMAKAAKPSLKVAPSLEKTRSHTSPPPWNDTPQLSLTVKLAIATYCVTDQIPRMYTPRHCDLRNLTMRKVNVPAATMATMGMAFCSENSVGVR